MFKHQLRGLKGVIWPGDESKTKEVKKGDYVQCRLRNLLFHVVKVGIVSSDPDENGYVQVMWFIDEENKDPYHEVSSHLPSFLQPIQPEDIKDIKEKTRVKGNKAK